MKIKELKVLLKEVYAQLTFKYEETKQGNNLVSVFSELNQFRDSLNKLETTGLFIKEIDILRKSGIYTTAQDFVNINAGEGRQLKKQIEDILRIIESVKDSIAQIGGESESDSISIKLPDLTDFKDLSDISRDFHKILSQTIINDQINGQVRIDNVENGSIWIDVYLGTAAAVSLVGGLAWAASVIYKKINEGRIIEEHVRSLKIKNDSLKEIQEKQKEALDLMIEAEAKNLHSENYEGEDNEQIERLKLSIKMLSNLIDKGAEIHPALNQPESVKNLFPKRNELELIESRIKKLN